MIIHRAGDHAVPVEAGRYLAANIPGAKYLELPGGNHVPWYEPEILDCMVGEIEEFLTGSRSETVVDRVLATVMFTAARDPRAAHGDIPKNYRRAQTHQRSTKLPFLVLS
jgi:hypothetical protein